ncbi:MAG: CPBP family intramembrane metalloprotease [Oscillospiraceae bacterium]|nr:CPBP family intramembrane metalloprotease [Oscillospiraceae bacterium]
MTEEKRVFRSPITRAEKIFGIIYILVHSVALPQLLMIVDIAARRHGLSVTDNDLNVIYYAVSFIVVLLFMFKFLRTSFSDIFDNFGRFLITAAISILVYYAVSALTNSILMGIMQDVINPSVENEIELTKADFNKTLVIAVLFAPVVEESVFRGALFGAIRTKSRIAAYIVTTLLFAVYHLWPYFIAEFAWKDLLYLLQYIPIGVILAWSYERSGTIWTSILVHALINYVAVSVQAVM